MSVFGPANLCGPVGSAVNLLDGAQRAPSSACSSVTATGGVADVVQPGGGFQEVGVRAENGCQAARSGGDAPSQTTRHVEHQ